MATLKNQIKSFTAEALKNEVTNFFVFLGGISGGTGGVDQSDISIISRITKDEVCVVAPRINWNANTIYEPYYFGSSGLNTYCYNNVTDMVYLCVGKNQPNGLVGDIDYPSTVPPSHTTGKQIYSDGYSWLALYKIDLYLNKFLTETELPINSLYDYTTNVTSGSYVTKYNSLCGDAGKTGNCYFYYNEDTKDPLTSTIYYKGDQVEGIGIENWICSTCHSVGDLLGYKSIHIDALSSQSKIVRNAIDELEEKINTNSIDTNDRFNIHYSNYKYEQELNGGIISLQLDVTGLSIEDRIVNVQEPTIKILDPRGDGAEATIQTYYDLRRNAFIANGITLKTPGTNYVNPQFAIPDAISVKLENNIKAVVTVGVEHPSSFLPNTKVSIIKKISNTDLEIIGTDQKVFSKVGIVSNVYTLDNVAPTLNIEPNETINGRVTSKVILNPVMALLPEINEGEVFLDIPSGETVTVKTDKTAATSSDYSSKLVAIVEKYDGTGAAVSSTLEIASVDEVSFQAKTTVKINDTNYTVDSVVNPEYKIDNIEYIVTNVTSNNIVYETTGSESSAKLSFLI